MSCSGNGSAVQYFYVQEVDGAIPAAPTFKPIRYNTSTLARNTAQVESNEINPARQRPLARQGTYSTQGDIVVELSDDSFDDLLEGLFQGTWATNTLKVGSTERSYAILERHTDTAAATLSADTISAAASDNSFNDSGSGFIAAGFKVGDVITTSGFTTSANNGEFTVTAVAAGKLTIGGTDGDAIVDEVAGDDVSVVSAMDFIYRGCRLNTLSVQASIDARVLMTFGVIGTSAETYGVPSDATLSAATSSESMVTSQGSLLEGGNAIGYATALNFSLNNGMQPTFALFQRAAYCVSNGVFVANGTLSAYLKDRSLYAKFLDETETALVATFSDGANTRKFTFPKVLYTQASKGVPGPDALIPEYTFSAGYDGSSTTTAQVDRT